MSVGLLIITHGSIGQSLYDAATAVLGSCPIDTKVVAMQFDLNRDEIINQVRNDVIELDHDEGVLILTDLYGATPANIACLIKNQNISIVAGINLPMLVSIFNYATLPLLELTVKAIKGGGDGIFLCQSKQD